MLRLHFRALAVILIAIVLPVSSYADSDPGDAKMGSTSIPGTIPVTSSPWVFSATIDDAGNGMSPTFGNALGSTIIRIDVTPQDGAYTTNPLVPNACDSGPYFLFCTAPLGDNGTWTFSGGTGIIPGCHGSECVSNSEFGFYMQGFNPGTWDFTMVLYTAAEPAAGWLLLVGMLAVMLYGRQLRIARRC